ncbi:hypothetical protein HYX13_05455 [Candidatus Woesearchaeota archaeon]|nr:hypothetical protein [Candidatus Woesearchaeota archaeon]
MEKNRQSLLLLGLALIVLIVLHFFLASEIVKMLILTAVILISLLAFSIGIRELLSPASRLRHGLEHLEHHLTQDPSAVLQEKYLHLHDLYLKLSEKEKRNFYGRLVHFRKQLEDHLRSEKRVEHLLTTVKKGTIAQRKKIFHELEKEFKKLPRVVGEKFYPHVVHAKEELEKGI